MEHNIYVQGRIVVRKSQNCTRDIEDLFSLFHPVVEIPYCVHFNGWRGFSKARYESLMLHVSLLDIGEGLLNTHFFLSKYYWLFRMEQSRVETQSIFKDVKGKIKFFLQKSYLQFSSKKWSKTLHLIFTNLQTSSKHNGIKSGGNPFRSSALNSCSNNYYILWSRS